MDQRPVEKRKDVLVYTSEPLKQDLEVTGPMRVVLYASTSTPDTDFTAKLIDVFPNGEARNLDRRHAAGSLSRTDWRRRSWLSRARFTR